MTLVKSKIRKITNNMPGLKKKGEASPLPLPDITASTYFLWQSLQLVGP
jgi:hypothetical protein